MDATAIEAQKLARRYGRRWALIDVSFSLPRGEVMMLAGRNGSGKTTLLRVLSTAIRPDAGSARILGADLTDREAVRKRIALLSHHAYVYESLSARENLGIAASFLGAGDVDEMLARVGLASRADDEVSTFSAGMRKRLSFARVLLQRPEIALLDEPYGQLDPEGFALVEDVVRELKARGATIVIATHQVDRVAGYADRILRLEGGRVAA